MTGYELYRRLRFYVGNGVRAATIPWKQHRVSIDETTTIFACSFGHEGWQHLRKTLEEYDADPDREARDTTLYAYLTRFCPTTICDLVDWPLDEPVLPLFVYPWGTFKIGETRSPKDAASSRFCGPSSPEFATEEYARTIRLYEAMKGVGYRPWDFSNTFIGGTMLTRRDGARRFVVLQGNHRLAILAHLGVTQLPVRDVKGYVPVVREADAAKWPLVADGTCRVDTALKIFNLYFESNGAHVGELLQAGRSLSRNQ